GRLWRHALCVIELGSGIRVPGASISANPRDGLTPQTESRSQRIEEHLAATSQALVVEIRGRAECAHGYPRFVIHDGSSSNLPLTALVPNTPPTPNFVGFIDFDINFPDCAPAATARFTSCSAKLWSCNIDSQ